MTPRTARRLVLWLCLVGYALTSGVGIHGLVLCLGPSGHVAIELADDEDCNGCVESEPLCDVTQTHFEPAPECPCEDVELPGARLLTRKFDFDAATPRIPPAPPCAVLWSCAVEPQPRFDARDAAGHFESVQRAAVTRPRSTVLLV